MQFFPVRQGNLPRLILSVYACRRRETEGRRRPRFSVCLFLCVCWSHSYRTSSLVTHGTLAWLSCSQCEVTAERTIPQRPMWPAHRVTKKPMAAACSHTKHDHVRNNQHCSVRVSSDVPVSHGSQPQKRPLKSSTCPPTHEDETASLSSPLKLAV